jgi:hypothetical protein
MHDRAVGVAQVVQSDDRHRRAAHDPVEGLAERVRVDGFAGGGGEHPVVGVDPDRRVLSGLHCSPAGEDAEGGFVEVYAASRAGGLAA